MRGGAEHDAVLPVMSSAREDDESQCESRETERAARTPVILRSEMSQPLPLPVWDRREARLFQEFMDDHKSTYESKPRRAITQWIQSQPIYDWAYAALQHTGRSRRQIEPFVRKYHIDMSEFEQVDYPSYAGFFVRRFRPGVRKFPSGPDEIGAFAEAR